MASQISSYTNSGSNILNWKRNINKNSRIFESGLRTMNVGKGCFQSLEDFIDFAFGEDGPYWREAVAHMKKALRIFGGGGAEENHTTLGSSGI